jgi:integrase
MVKELLVIPLFERFIKETKNGKRRKLNGEPIKLQTTRNYFHVLVLLKKYEEFKQVQLRVTVNILNNKRLLVQEQKYWKDFYRNFSDYLLYHKGCFDNYTGNAFKILKCFFQYLRNEKFLNISLFYKRFYVRKEEIRIITLLPEQFCYLILDQKFHNSLTWIQRKHKDMFVFGCTAALRFSDLMNLCVKDIEYQAGNYFLHFRSVKTDTPVNVKLPAFAVDIFQHYARRKSPDQKLFPRLAKPNFNSAIQKIGTLAGWTESIGKCRTKNGVSTEIYQTNKKLFRFCDQLSSHVMRRTGITTLLMLGMPEYLVRKISGHCAHSKSFYRYVNFAQSYITDEIDKAHQKLLSLYQQ